MNAIAKLEQGALSTLQEGELLEVLQSSLYPGAKPDSIKLVLGYCKAAGLDPMQKPVHIVPMNVKKPGTRDQYEWRDTIMPGIGLYRTQAARSGQFAGVDEPEFGPEVELRVGEFVLSYPEWCKVTVYRMVDGVKCAYTAKEYWVENYATAGKDTQAPNAMWKKRPRGQIAKCAQAQALRLAFPEMTGSAPTAEEMEGKFAGDDDRTVDMAAGAAPAPTPAPEKTAFPDADFDAAMPAWQKARNKGKSPAEILATVEAHNPLFALSEAQKAKILALKAQGDAPTTVTPKDGAKPDAVGEKSVQSAMDSANDIDTLNEAASQITLVADPEARKRLDASYDKRLSELQGAN